VKENFMQESKNPKSGPAQGATGAREREATSGETLGDLEETQKITGPKTGATGGGGERSSVPAPDGTPEPGRGGGRADGSDTGGPM